MKHWFTNILALVAALTLPLGLKAQDGPVLSVGITQVGVTEYSQSVASVTMTNQGTGYTDTPTIVFSGGGGTVQATGFATYTDDPANPGKSILASITLLTPGSGYTSNPTITITSINGQPGTGATAQAVIANGVVVAVQVVNPGSGYIVPRVTLTASAGFGAAGSATVVNGAVTAINLSSSGEGFSVAPSIAIFDPLGVGANAAAQANMGYRLSKITLTNSGAGYKSDPTADFTDTNGGRNASGKVCVSNGKVTGVIILNGGSGFTTNFPVAFSAPNADMAIGQTGTQATGTAIVNVTTGKVTRVDMIDQGAGYVSVPTVYVSGGGGPLKFVKPILDPVGSGAISYITFADAGGFVTIPNVTIANSGVSGVTSAVGTAILGYPVLGVSIAKASGASWLSFPSVTVSAPTYGTDRAVVQLITSTNSITGIRLVSRGSGYTSPPIVTFSGGTVILQNNTATAGQEDYPIIGTSIGTSYDAPFQNEAYGPAHVPVLIAALGQGTFPVAGYTYKFYVNGKSIGSPPPVDILDASVAEWTPPEPGVYFFHVEMTDGFGNTATSLSVRYHATGTSIISPLDNTLVPQGSSVVVQASAVGKPNSTNAFVDHIDFYEDGVKIVGATDYNYPYSYIYTPQGSSMDHVLEARAYDNNGNQVSPNGTALVNLHMVYRAIGERPTVSITSPVHGSSIPVTDAIKGVPVTVLASSPAGRVSKVELYVDGVLNSTTSAYPYAFTWTPTTSGSYKLCALVYDDKNNVVVSGTNIITISTPPKAVWVKDYAPTTATALQPVEFRATGQATGLDANGNAAVISSITFTVNGGSPVTVLSSAATNGVYVFKWTPPSASTTPYIILATATDSNGLTGASESLSVLVSEGTGGGVVDPTNAAPVVAIATPLPISPSTYVEMAVGSSIPITATATDSDGSVAFVRFFMDDAQIGADDTQYPFTTNWTATKAGVFSLRAVAFDDKGKRGDSTVIRVRVSNASPQLPAIAITLPVANTTAAVGVPMTIAASATDDTSVSSVQFYVNGVALGSADTAYPYQTTWTPSSVGVYTLTAWATDDAGNVNSATPVIVNVTSPAVVSPTVTLSVPSTAPVNSATTLVANATDDVSIAAVQFYVNGVATGSPITAYPYTLSWTPTSLGNYTIVARATDNDGNSTNSASSVIQVLVDSAPNIVLTSPAVGSTVQLRSSVTLTAVATDDAAVASVRFYIDGVAVGSALTASPYTTTWVPTAKGTFSITAIATDNKGQTTTATARSITVDTTNAPQVSLTAPLDDSDVPVNAPTLLQADANDNVTVASVQFYVNGFAFGSPITSYPYTLAWTPTTLGNYTIVARATDNEGNTTDSTAATVHVVLDGRPTVTLVSPAANTSVEIRTAVTLTATATDDSAVAGVQFLVNGTALAFVSTSPYTTTWTPVASGTYVISAIAIDNKANQSLPATRTVTVTASTAPVVSITAPTEGSSVTVNTITTLKATATDNVAVASVQFYVNGVAYGSAVTAYPYNLAWTPTSPGNYTIVARATDNEGNQTDSAVRSVKVVASNFPTISITNPLDGASVPVNSATTLVANAEDSNGTVVSVQFYVNGVAYGSAVTTYPYKLDWTPVTKGTYTLRARATDNEGLTTDSAQFTVTVIDSSPPTVSLTSPFAGAELYIGAPIALIASAADADGTVASVQFYANDVLVGTSTSSPYTVAWSPTLAGPYTLVAKATDNIGVVTTSAKVSVTVKDNPAPIVSVTKPVANSADVSYYTGAIIELAAIASDSDGTTTTTDSSGNSVTTNIPGSIKQVQFFINDVLIYTADAEPYTYSQWIPSVAGTYSIVAKATDSKGAVGTSNARVITVLANSAPVVSITAPVASATLRVNTPVTINASASDPDGSVAKVAFYLGDTLLAEDAEFPYTTSWTPVSPGRYSISARVYDNNGRYTVSAAVPVIVADPSSGAPTISITNPVANTAALGTGVTLVAAASDPDGSIASVEFFIDGKAVGSLLTATPYSFTWTPTSAGIYTVSARATDNLGNQTDSAIRSITVSAGVAPVVTLSSPAASATYAAGASVVFSATVTDANDKVASVVFLVDDVVEATLTSAPYLITRIITDARAHTFVVRATDAAGNITISPTRIFTIRSNQVPTVALVTPSVTTAMKVGSSLQLEASAADSDGSIASLDFLVNDLLLASTNTAPYKTSWTPLSEGVYKVTALATDNAGAITRSADVYVRVTTNSLSAVDSIYSGTYLGTGASGKFAFINEHGSGGAFISYSDSGAKVSRYAGMTIDSSGAFSVTSGSTTLISGIASATGVSGYLGATGTSPMFLGTLSFVSGKVPPGLYTGSVVSRATTDVTAIVSEDGQITAAVVDGSFSDAGRGTVSSTTGAFSIAMVGGSTLTGTLNLTTGFITATLTGTVSGKVLASNSSAVVINDGSLLNLSSRGLVAPGKTLVAGFVVGGTASKQILVRAVGPKLLTYGVPSGTQQPDPKLVVTNVSNNTVVGTNDNWSGADIVTASAKVGAFALDAGSKDAVLLLTLAPGSYTAEISAAGTESGVALVELFDVDTPQPFAPQKLLNISARAEVGGTEKTLTAGFVISGDTSKKVLIRAVGPTLKPYGVSNYLADPVIFLRRLVNNVWVDVRENDNSAVGNDAALVRNAGAAAGSGLQLLSSDTTSAELVVSLPAGTYTAEVRSGTGTVGVVLVEVYEVP